MTHPPTHPEDSGRTPADLHAVETLLDRLGASDRRAAPAEFETRVERVVAALLKAPPQTLKFPSRRSWRLAAGIMVVAGAGLAGTWLAVRGTPISSPPIALQPPVTGSAADPIDPETLRAEMDELLTTWEADATELAAEDERESFWEHDEGLMAEEPAG